MLKIDNAVVVLVDIQGKLATLMHDRDNFFENLTKLVRGAKTIGLPIIWNEQLPDKLGPTIPDVKSLLADNEPLPKNTFSCCGNPEFSSRLKSLKRKQVLLAGMESHVCVYQTGLDLLKSGYEVSIVADAISSRSAENKQLGIDAMRDAGALLTSVEMALFEMLIVAEGDIFREVVKIVK